MRVEIALENRGRAPVSLVEVVDSFGAALADRKALLDPGPLRPGRRHRLAYRTAVLAPLGRLHGRPAQRLGLGLAGALLSPPRPARHPALRRVPAGARRGRPRAARRADELRPLGAHRPPAPAAAPPTWACATSAPATTSGGCTGPPPRGTRGRWSRSSSSTSRRTSRSSSTSARDHRAGTGRKSTLEYVVRTAASLLAAAARAATPSSSSERAARRWRCPRDGGSCTSPSPSTGSSACGRTARCRLPRPRPARAGGRAPGLDGGARGREPLPRRGRARRGLRLDAGAPRAAGPRRGGHGLVPPDRPPLPSARRGRGAGGRAAGARPVPRALLALFDAEQDLPAELGRPDWLEAA